MGGGRLPNLLLVGVPKSGTGSLFAYLSQHPDICPSDEKEVGYFNFFNPRRNQGSPPPIEVYQRHFDHWRDERYAFEATPTYSYGGQPVIDAIRATLPAPKVMLTLRNPVDRMWSAYTFQRELGNFTRIRSFEEYVDVCEQRRRDGSALVPRDHLHGLHIGFYADYVPLWLEAFGADIRVVFAEDLAVDPGRVMRGVFEWLGVDASVADEMDLARRNTTNHPRSVRAAHVAYSVKRRAQRMRVLPPRLSKSLHRLYLLANKGERPGQMAPGTRRRLEGIYRESNRDTGRTLTAHGYADLPAWLRSAAGAEPRATLPGGSPTAR